MPWATKRPSALRTPSTEGAHALGGQHGYLRRGEGRISVGEDGEDVTIERGRDDRERALDLHVNLQTNDSAVKRTIVREQTVTTARPTAPAG